MTGTAIVALAMFAITCGALAYAWISVKHAKKNPTQYEKSVKARLECGREESSEYEPDSIEPVLANADV